MEPTAAQERAGEIGTEMAARLVAKLEEAIDGFPASTGEQRNAVASLVIEGLENYAERQLKT